MFLISKKNALRAVCLLSATFGFSTAYANETKFEITPFAGYMVSSDLQEYDSSTDISVDAGPNFGIGFAWQDTPKGQGQILINYVSHDFSGAEGTQDGSVDIIYTHFNGIAQFRQNAYVTTVSMGLGAGFFDTDASSEVYPSFTAAIGTRYEFSDAFAFITELRTYASLVDEDKNSFCKDDVCIAQYNGSLWYDTSLSVGLAFSF